MKPAKIAVICVAALAAVGLALLVRSMGSSNDDKAQTSASAPAVTTAKVLVAARDLPQGTQITSADMVWKDWPLADVHEAYVTDGAVARPVAETPAEPAEKAADGSVTKVVNAVVSLSSPTAADELSGSVVREGILAGEPIQVRKLVRAGDSGFMAAFLEPGMRAMSVSVSAVSAAGGFILPGDRVDVILTREVDVVENNQNSKRTVSATVLQNLKVLAVDQATELATEERSVVGATATVEVNSRDAEILALARAQGELTIVLRSYADAGGPRGLIPGAVRRGESGAMRTSADGADPRTVRIFRGNATPEEVVLQ